MLDDGTPAAQVTVIRTCRLPRRNTATASAAGPALTSSTRNGLVADHDTSFAVPAEGHTARTVSPADDNVRSSGSAGPVVVDPG